MNRLKLRLTAVCLAALILACGLPVRADTLGPGDAGEQVTALKTRLYELGYFSSKKFSNDYNDVTAQHVREFQLINGLAVTGDTDEATWEALFAEDARTAFRPAKMTEDNYENFVWPVLPNDFPVTDDEGFLPSADQEPYVYASRENGFWCYISHDAHIEIRRMYEGITPLTWFESEIWLRGEERLRSLMDPKFRKLVNRDPREIAKDYQAVLAVSDDFYGYRYYHETQKAGIIVRERQVVYNKTKKSGTHTLPNMDVIALFEDGTLKTFDSQEYTAQEYLDMGVTDTWAFGPILLRDGEIDERLLESAKYYVDIDPRSAIGMVEPNHYIILSVLGRQTESLGIRPIWLAQRMQDLGCTEALNLDGGNTIAVVFMGDMINKPEGANTGYMKGIRFLSSMIGAGTIQ